ncbi:MAG TPA: carboxypeptidase-like regulatory domain-containing protein [Longimicrobiales bacterium]
MKRLCRRQVLPGLLAAALSVVLCLPVAAQNPATGSLAGVVVDAAGLPLSDALVTITEIETGEVRSLSTDHTGTFRFLFLFAGTYELRVERLSYVPKRVTGIRVRPGPEIRVHAELMALGSVSGLDEEVSRAAARSGGGAGRSQWLADRAADVWPLPTRRIGELGRLSSQATDDLVIEGLPAWLSATVVDGIPFRAAGHPLLRRAWSDGTAFSSSFTGAAELVTNGVDVQWGGAAGSYLAAHTQRGSSRVGLDARAGWTTEPESDAASSDELNGQGSAVLRAPLGESARMSAGVDVRSLGLSNGEAWPSTPEVDALIAEVATRGVDVDRPLGLSRDQGISAFSRFDWSVAPEHRWTAGVHFASQSAIPGLDPRTLVTRELEGTDLVAGMSLLSTFGPRVGNDVRISFTSSTRTSEASDVPTTVLAGDAIAFGGPTHSSRNDEKRLLLNDALHIARSDHSLQIGAGASLSRLEYDARPDTAGEFFYGSVADFTTDTGVLVRTRTAARSVDWTTLGLTGFARDLWSAGEGVEVLVGFRIDTESLPVDDIRLDSEWQRLSGLANNAPEKMQLKPAGRVGVTWDVAGDRTWVLQLGAAIDYDRVDPLLIARWITDDGTASTGRTAGGLSWPDDPGTGATLPRLTLLSTGFAAPRTGRLSAGVTHRLGEGTTLNLSGTVRRTDRLPRTVDMNLLPLPAFTDQFGGPVFGTPVQVGGVLTVQPGTGRRFDTYDVVARAVSDGWSDHWGLTVGLEHELQRGLGVLARYTFGHTEDNWFAGAHGGWTVPVPHGVPGSGEWAEGTSDFDVPHRAVAGAVYDAGLAQLSLLYRVQSERPFTPGFRYGVDANADGVPGNEPAFVDAALPGMDALLDAWPCLRESIGSVVERNGCRGSLLHTLDMSVTARLIRTGGFTAALILDAFDLLDAERDIPDAALYLVDPNGTLAIDTVARTVDLPLLVNPNFGKPLARPEPGRRLRVALSLKW